MTWFWMDHFNVNARKDNIRALVGDDEESVIRPLALGRFRDLLGATMRHPAMLRYLDNAQNAAGRINQNDRDYPVRNKYRAVFGGLFARMYGLSPAQLDRVFAGVAPKDLALV